MRYYLTIAFIAIVTYSLARGEILPGIAADAAPSSSSEDRAAGLVRALTSVVDEQTLLVGHVDLQAVDVAAALDRWTDIVKLPEPDRTLFSQFRTTLVRASSHLKEAGARDLFVVLSVADLPNSDLFFVVPIAPTTDTAAVERTLGVTPRYNEIGRIGQRFGDVFVVGRPTTIKRLKAVTRAPRPEIAAAFAAAPDKTAQLLFIPSADTRRVFEEIMPTLPKEMGGGQTRVLTEGVRWATVGIDLPPKKLALRIVAQSADEAAAGAFATEMEKIAAALSTVPGVLELIPNFADFVAAIKPQRVDDRLEIDVRESDGSLKALTSLLTPPIELGRLNSARARSMNNLKQQILALQTHYDAHQKFPPRAVYSTDGKPLLSWRVQILPYLNDGSSLYKEFKLDEPWDSEHNRKLIERMPEVFQSPLSAVPAGRTTYLAPVFEGSIFGRHEAMTYKEMTDGSSNTIMIVDSNADHAVIWTKPDDIEIDATDPARGLRNERLKGFCIGVADGSTRVLPNDSPPQTLKALFTAGGGESVVWP